MTVSTVHVNTSIVLCPLTSYSRMYDVCLWDLLTWSFEELSVHLEYKLLPQIHTVVGESEFSKDDPGVVLLHNSQPNILATSDSLHDLQESRFMLESRDHRTLISTRSERGPSTTLTVHVIRAMFGCDFVPPNLHLCRFGRRRWHGCEQAIAMLVTRA